MRINDFSRMTNHLTKKFNTQMKQMVEISTEVSKTMHQMEELQEIRKEALLELVRPKRLKAGPDVKNRHQIGKLCPHCNEYKDPRGYKKHEHKCARVHRHKQLPKAA